MEDIIIKTLMGIVLSAVFVAWWIIGYEDD